MRYHVSVVKEALKIVFKEKGYIFGVMGTAVLIFFMIIAIPLLLVPGNDLAFQLSIMPPRAYGTIALLGLLTGVSIMLNLYVFNREKDQQVKKVGMMSVTGGFGIISSFFGSITCVACASTILGFLGIGTVTFLLAYRFQIVLLSILFILLSVYFTSRKVLNLCDVCKTG